MPPNGEICNTYLHQLDIILGGFKFSPYEIGKYKIVVNFVNIIWQSVWMIVIITVKGIRAHTKLNEFEWRILASVIQINFGSNYGWSLVRRQAIISTDAGILCT